MTVDELRNLIKDYDECQGIIKHLEEKLKKLKENKYGIFTFTAQIGDEYIDDEVIYFHHLGKVFNKEMFETFIQQIIDQIREKTKEMENKIERLDDSKLLEGFVEAKE